MSDDRPLGEDAIETSSRIGHPRESPRSTGPIEFVGEYKILGKLGEGGMGVVYEAEQASPRRRVALKIVRGGSFADPQQARLLEREASALARLRHPGIAAIYEAGRTEDGLGFFAMEIVRGTSLGRYLELHSPELSPSEVRRRLALFRKIADAVHYAHQRGVLHRDLKPSNIFVTTETVAEGALPEVKILDFGLARITDADVANVSRSIEVGVIKGTLSYMSPEQARGNPDEIDIRSDVYALGVILFEMLTGSRPYDISHAPLLEAIRIIEHEAPRSLRDAYPGSGRIDPDVETILLKSLEKDPARRYGSAAAFSEDVGRFLSSEPIHARPPSVTYQVRKFAARNKVLVAGVTATLLALVGGITASTILGFREAAQRREAERARDDLQAVASFQAEMLQRVRPEPAGQALIRSLRSRIEEARKRAGSGSQEIRTALDELDRSLEGVNATDLARDLLIDNILGPADAAVRSGFGDRPPIEARLRESIGKTYRSLGAYDQADVEARRLLEITRATGTGLEDALLFAGDVALARGHFDEAIAHYDEGLSLSGGESSRSLSAFELRNAKVRALWSAGRFDEAEPLARSTLDAERAELGPDARITLDTQNLVAVVDWGRGRIEEAAKGYEAVLTARLRLFGADDPETDDVRNNLGVAYWRLGRFGEAERLLVDTVRSRTRRLGEDHPQTLDALGTLGIVYMSENRFPEAESIYRRILELRTATLGDTHVATLRTMNNLGVNLTKQGRLDEGEATFRRALAIYERTGRTGYTEYAVCLHSLGELEIARGRWAAAKADLDRAGKLYHERGSPNLELLESQLAEVNAKLRGE